MRSSCLVACLVVTACAAPTAPAPGAGSGAATADSSAAADGGADGTAPAADVAAEVSATVTEYVATDADFDCIKNGTKVGHFYVANRLGKLDEAAAVAKAGAKGAVYPLGTVIRLFPLEAMVKRGGAAFAATGGWEMFKLKFSNNRTVIASRGGTEVKNAAGPCVGCHAPAKDYDFVCGGDHGCAPLGVTAETAEALQDGDPSCPTQP